MTVFSNLETIPASQREITLWGYNLEALQGQDPTKTQSSSIFFSFYVSQPSSGDGDSLGKTIWLAKGNYSLTVIYHKGASRGIVDYAFGVISIGTIDMYAAANTYNQISTMSFTVSSDQSGYIKSTVNGKNASSSGHTTAQTRWSIKEA